MVDFLLLCQITGGYPDPSIDFDQANSFPPPSSEILVVGHGSEAGFWPFNFF